VLKTWPGARLLAQGVPGPVLLLLIGVAINRAGSFLQIFLVLYLTGRGFSPEQAGLVLTAYSGGAVVGILLGGTVSDRIGYRRTIGLSMILSGLLVGSLVFTQPYAILLAVCASAGLVAQVFRPAASSLLAALTPPTRLVMASAGYRLALNLGATTAPLLGAVLMARSYGALFVVDMLTSLGFGAAALLWLTDGPESPASAGTPAAGGYSSVARDTRFLLVVAALFLISIVEIQYVAALPLEVEARQLPTSLYGMLIALNGLLVIAIELPLTRVIQHWPVRRAISLGIALIGLGVSLYGVAGGAPWLVAATVVWTLGEIVAAPSVSAYPALVSPPNLRGRYLAAASASQSIGYAVGPALGAALFQHAGGGVWVVCGMLAGVATAIAAAGVRQPATVRPAGEAGHAGDEIADGTSALAGDPPLRGVLDGDGLAPLVGLLATLKAGGTLAISNDLFRARLYLDDGAVVGATFGLEAGLDALEAIGLLLGQGVFAFSQMAGDGKRNLSLEPDGVHRYLHDLGAERARLGALIPSLLAVPRIRRGESASNQPVTVDREALRLLLLFDGARTVADLVRLCGAASTLRHLGQLVRFEIAELELPGMNVAGPTWSR
jgi:MFS family permease